MVATIEPGVEKGKNGARANMQLGKGDHTTRNSVLCRVSDPIDSTIAHHTHKCKAEESVLLLRWRWTKRT